MCKTLKDILCQFSARQEKSNVYWLASMFVVWVVAREMDWCWYVVSLKTYSLNFAGQAKARP